MLFLPQNHAGGAEGQRRQGVAGEPIRSVGIVGGDQVPIHDFGSIDKDEVRAARMLAPRHDTHHPYHVDPQACLPQTFTGGRFGGILARVHETRGQGPQAAIGLIDAPYQKYAAVLFDQDSRGHLWVRKMDPIAPRANRADLAKTFGVVHGPAAARTKPYFIFLLS